MPASRDRGGEPAAPTGAGVLCSFAIPQPLRTRLIVRAVPGSDVADPPLHWKDSRHE